MISSSSLLLHCCCGPCATASIDRFVQLGYKVVPYFFNPNIEPSDEQKRRLDAFLAVCQSKMLTPIVEDHPNYSHKRGQDRCFSCYSVRLERAKLAAQRLGLNYFSTSLLISPYQKHELIKQVGSGLGGFVYEDLRTSYKDSQQQAKELGIYKQKYCACLESLEESKWLAKRKSEMKRQKSGPTEEWVPRWLVK